MNNPFGHDTTADEVLSGRDLTGTTAVVTGASGGIGLETARSLAAHGARVIIAARNADKLAAAVEAIHADHPDAAVETCVLDLADLASVRTAGAELLERAPQLDLLLNNAGVMATPEGRTADGFETQFGVNHLGHFLLTLLLEPALTSGNGARVVNVSSAGHGMGPVDFDDLNFERRPYDKFSAYGQSKKANILFSVGLDQRWADKGVRAFAVHPGGIHTDLGRYFTPDDMAQLQAQIKASSTGDGGSFQWKSVPAGAATTVWAATSPDLDGDGGLYLEDCGRSHPRVEGGGAGTGYEPQAVDPENADRLWQVSLGLVGLS